MNDPRASRKTVNESDAQTLRTLASMPAFRNWRQPVMPRRIVAWVRMAGKQELMSVVAAGLNRLNRSSRRHAKR